MSETKVITGLVRLSYLNVWKPRAQEDGGEPKYSACLIIKKSDKKTIRAIQAAIEAAKQEGVKSKWGGKLPKNLKLPLRDGDDERGDDPAFEDAYFINVSSRRQPQVVDRRLELITEHEDLYSGCYGHVSINFFAFEAKGSRGVAGGLNNIQKVKDGEPLSGGSQAKEDFKVIEDDDEEDEAPRKSAKKRAVVEEDDDDMLD